ncbi:MAG TPA: GGDEF domain-containing protein [Burkholderiales bacterium]|nr:GGDEF domain-containing protein [Burkholderiales bacterium]
MPFFGPVGRICVGLVSLTLFLIFVADFAFGVLRDDVELAQRVRKGITEDMAIQLAILIQKEDKDSIQRTIDALSSREGEITSVGIRRNSGDLYIQTADHEGNWVPLKDGKSTITHVAVPVYAGKDVWGSVEVSFRPVLPKTVMGWVKHPLVLLLVVISVGGYLLYYWYMRRVLEHLDPTKAIPDRVRKALDTLTEGVIVLDTSGRVVLANQAFRELHGEDKVGLSARRASEIPWLKAALGGEREPEEHPWAVAMRDGATVTGDMLEIPHNDDGPRKAKLAASPITDGRGAVRGCLVSFTDVTELDRKNTALQGVLSELEASRQKIEAQNEELKGLANIDPLTGCLNRRAFFEQADEILKKAKEDGSPVCCLMTDIDKFKTFNDQYGHAVGDQVLVQVARVLKAALRPTDVLCRYGGEEFCILLPGVDALRAAVVSERIRFRVEAQAGPGIRSIPGLRVTSSFGLSSMEFGAPSLKSLMEEADQALYAAKQAGRNKVVRYDEMPPQVREAAVG